MHEGFSHSCQVRCGFGNNSSTVKYESDRVAVTVGGVMKINNKYILGWHETQSKRSICHCGYNIYRLSSSGSYPTVTYPALAWFLIHCLATIHQINSSTVSNDIKINYAWINKCVEVWENMYTGRKDEEHVHENKKNYSNFLWVRWLNSECVRYLSGFGKMRQMRKTIDE